MAFVNLGGDDSKPTYFEVLAADRLVPGLRAAVVYALSVLSQRRSWLHRLLAYEDELLAVLMLAVDWHTLGAADATFAESLYGLRRVPLLAHQPHNKQQPPPQPLRLTRRQKLLALAAEVIIPYTRAKADRLYAVHAHQGLLGLALSRAGVQGPHAASASRLQDLQARLRHFSLRAFLVCYPYLHAGMELSTFGFHLAYLLGAAPAHRPVLHLLGMQMARVSAQDLQHQEQRKRAARAAAAAATRVPGRPAWVGAVQRGALTAGQLMSDHYRNALIMVVFGFKALEWWFTSAEERLAAGKALAPPPPPPPIHPHGEGVGLPADPRLCPACRKPVVNPAQVATSGYVLCYTCAFDYIQTRGLCPVTRLPTSVDHVRKLYDAM